MSRTQPVETECSNCGKTVKSEVWLSINPQINPEAKAGLLNREINVIQCPSCETNYSILNDLLYHDMEKQFCVQFLPFQQTTGDKFLDRFTEEAQLDMGLEMNGVEVPEYFKDIHYVFSMGELSRYVLFRDRLAQRKTNIRNGKPACFSCNKDIPEDEQVYSVSRLRRKRCSSDATDDEVIEAISSIQVCRECTAKAGVERIEIKERPIPLLNGELDHFHHFAAWLADNTKELPNVPSGSDKCSLCARKIKDGELYTQLEVTEEVHTANGVEVKKEYVFSILCNGCSENHLVWL